MCCGSHKTIWLRSETSFGRLGTNSSHLGRELRESKEELHADNNELRAKVTLLDGARREAFEATNSAKRLDEECGGLRGDLHQQITLVS